jgi:acyl carrier protein
MNELKEELKVNIIEALNLEEFTPADIADDDALFGDGLGLDSIDALELIVLLDKDYGIKLTDPEKSKAIFESIEVLATYVAENRKK